MNKDFKEFKDFIKGKKTAVVGIGISNRPLIDYLIKLGAKVTAFDKKSKDQLGDTVEELEIKGINLVLGENYLDELKGFEVVFKTPSMRIDSKALLNCKAEGAYITSEMEEFIKYCPGKIYGITGSDGKTTTTTLIYNMLKEEGYNTWIGGNIGTPLFSKIEEMKAEDKVVLELSSFQLMTIREPIEVALITNLSPNHLDIHKGMEEYIEAKKNIFKYQRKNDLLVLNRDNDITNSMVNESLGKVIQFSIKEKITDGAYYSKGNLYINNNKVCGIDEMKLKGMHNVENLLAAFSCVNEDVSLESMRKVATSFAGVEHRMEFIKEIGGVKYYNDSIASSPTRTLAGLKAFDKKVILIAGGYDKKISFNPLAEEGYKNIKALILLGVTRVKIQDAFEKVMREKEIYIPIFLVDSLEGAVSKAKDISKEGDIVTLSPACASFDMFPNFEVRGNRFKEIINNL
ncbi:UDP-N-acetylmuramoylalanine--D-glutamate ligase [Clostridium tetanomorphum]|uniref:UDP-N-acetylmuramoylalanine--D-glutamate ligase n=1 Tax=Clostridium tetanomorphum TaxID=1553 RepID=A0A923EDF7_CLOTT|nr:UDP-N-acetylmuramoyl-L-alanine--D-glutamate ligase [Clostridium tetanomorphum]KAJ49243.1 UDP-N-acetylmuramoyl-L-alanyl-D-glutamate synthetase [Clostridium tetanomorphum DSM 665]KAJ52736.1 UDP-N-acetylmuramoyl-L-alanyl-D-glutamate synthetase [Clostridium tetanomorphum DSM 665]MBC2400041.1 UDP-N-acetylmuramoyl-L-alanine--D-glutamate ligase [Clostridium tetanomorphum]MBP1866489.1 UDP-N-acetylmuramoylalanine--D-glutamate ligase [Clostridium tetanomorphum]NRS86389.1 UDP-N-acetylmuramoylalanine--